MSNIINIVSIAGRKIPRLLITFATIITISFQISTPALAGSGTEKKIYLPFISSYEKPKILLGLYAQSWLGVQSNIDSYLNDFSNWSGKKLTFAGTFIGFGDQNYQAAINMQFDLMWTNGYTPFVNLMSDYSLSDINSGKIDGYITEWANWLKKYIRDGERSVYIAPLPEMNGQWTKYYGTPDQYKNAYKRIQQLFYQTGIPKASIRWVFAPNGDSTPDSNFEYYYPGDDIVDVVGFSVYNYEGCYNSNPVWHSLEDMANGYIHRMQAMAPTKPIFITQVATSAKVGSSTYDHELKNQWLRDAYAYLETEPNVRGIIYFNYDGECDQAIYRVGDTSLPKTYEGYKDAVSSENYGYISPIDLRNMVLLPN